LDSDGVMKFGVTLKLCLINHHATKAYGGAPILC